MRLVLPYILFGLFLVGALGIEGTAAGSTQGNMLELRPHALENVYGIEPSNSTIPHPYRWTRPFSSVPIWPHNNWSLLELTYLNQQDAGLVMLTMDRQASVALRPAPQIRILHILLPSSTERLSLQQIAPLANSRRALGLIVINGRWHNVQRNILDGIINNEPRLLAELPLTLVLLYALLLVLHLPLWCRLFACTLLLALEAGIVATQPWDVRAMQGSLQWVLSLAVVGALAVPRIRRVARWMRNGRRIIVGLWLFGFLMVFSPWIHSDGIGYYAYLRSALIDHDLRFDDEFDSSRSPFAHMPALHDNRTVTGYTPNLWSVGPAFAWLPFWLIAHGTVLVGHQLGLSWQADGYAEPYVVLTSFGSAIAGLATLVGCWHLARRYFSTHTAVLSTVVLYLGSNLLYYAQLDGSYAHSLSAASTTWFVLAVLHLDDKPSIRRWLLLGLAAGAMILCYWVTALLLILPLVISLRHLLLALRQRSSDRIIALLLGTSVAAGAAFVVVSPQLLVWKTLYGTWLAAPQGSSFITPQGSHLLDILWGPVYGLAWWTPAFAVGLGGSIWFAFKRPWPGGVLLLTAVLYLAYNSSLPDWNGSGAFGLRRLTALTPIFLLGLAMLYDALQRWATIQYALGTTIVGWGLGMIGRYSAYRLPRGDLDRLESLGLRSILLHPPTEAAEALLIVVRTSYWSKLIHIKLGDVLISFAVLLALALCMGGWYALQLFQSPSAS